MESLDNCVKRRMQAVETLAWDNAQYKAMLQENAILEHKFNDVLSELTTEQMNTICDFLMHCEAMSDRMLEIACTYMRFPG